MEGNQGVIIAWLIALTIGLLVSLVRSGRDRSMVRDYLRQVNGRMGQLDIREAMQDVVGMVRKRNIHEDARLREAVERLIERLEADPLTASRYIIDITALKEKIR